MSLTTNRKPSNPISRMAYSYDSGYGAHNDYTMSSRCLTTHDVVTTTILLLLVTSGTAIFSAYSSISNPSIASLSSIIGCIGVTIMSFVMVFSASARKGSALISIIFAIFEGLMLGGFTFSIGSQDFKGVPGWNLVGQALIATVGLFVAAMVLYGMKVVKVTDKLMSVVATVSAGFGMLYLINFIAAIAFRKNFLFAQGPIPIIIAVVAIVFATLSFFNDLEYTTRAVENGSPAQLRWTIATGYLVSIVWLYIEILRLLYLTKRD